jgi:hypothetical protein
MKSLILSIICMFWLSQARALEHYLGAGLNLNTYSDELPPQLSRDQGFTLAPTLGFKSLARWGNVAFRTGAFFEWKRVNLENRTAPGLNDIELRAYYVAIPINLQFELNPRFAVFGGITPRVLLTGTCRNCVNYNDDFSNLVNYYNAGVTYYFDNAFSLDLLVHQAQSDNVSNLRINAGQLILYWRFE